MTFTDYAQIVMTGGMRYNGSVISWGRSEQRNAEVGGHINSGDGNVVGTIEAGTTGQHQNYNNYDRESQKAAKGDSGPF